MDRLHPGTHPDFLGLLNRYENDRRFTGNEADRQKCIDYLLELNDWVQLVSKPPEIQAVLLAGSFSALNPEPPDLRPFENSPKYRGVRRGGSDIEVLFVYSSNLLGLLRLKWLDFNIPERELEHPDNFLTNTWKDLRRQLFEQTSRDLSSRIEMGLFALTPTLGKYALKRHIRHMITTGTLMWGSLAISDYGKRRDNPPKIKRPDIDPILYMMDGGF